MRRNMSVKINTNIFAVLYMAMFMIAACIMLLYDGSMARVNAASDGSLTVTSMPVAYTPTGSYIDIPFNVKNNTSHDVTGISVIGETYVTDGDGYEWTPYTFQYTTRSGVGASPAPVNATEDELGYTIKAGQTATFYLRVTNKADRKAGSYNDFIQLGRKREELYSNYDPVEDMTTIGIRTIVEAEYTDNIPVTNVVYDPQNAALTVGTSSNYGGQIDPFGSVIDYGTINFATAGEDVLSQSTGFFIKNTSPVGNDEHGNPLNIFVSFGLKNTDDDYGNFCFGCSSNTMSGASWAPLPPATETSFSTASGALSLNASEYIAGTYETEFVINTSPFGTKVNGSAVNVDGAHVIPVKVKLTGINPRLPKRVEDLTVSPGNNQIQLSWTAPDEGIEYMVYRREGKETSTNPDTWTAADWNNYECLNTYGVRAKDDGTYIYVDGTVENGKTYSYVVAAGSPFKSYASIPVSETPKSVYVSRLLPPDDVFPGEEIGGVMLRWKLNELYGGISNNGESMVDHFNIYRDGVLVKQVMQNSVTDTPIRGMVDDGEGNQQYGIKSHEYEWETFVETPITGKDYSFSVSAVSISGLEGYLSEDVPGMGIPENIEIISHTATYSPWYYEEYDKGITIPAICVSADVMSYGDTANSITVWRNEGTAAPDTGAAPYIPYKSEEKSFDDMNVVPGKVYTYTIMVTDYEGNNSNYYTFTAKAEENINSSAVDVEWSVIERKKAHMEWYADSYYDYDLAKTMYNASYKVYRNNALLEEVSGKEKYTIDNDPGADGTYIYRVDKITGGITIRGREFTFVRDTKIVDESTFLKAPGAPVLNARVVDGKPVLEWKNSVSGGKPSGYYIYRKDAGEFVLGSRSYRKTPWYSVEYNKLWGNSRYLVINDTETSAFVDGAEWKYHGDDFLGNLQSVSWDKEDCPHEYYVTAFNDVGESEPSKIYTFEYTEDEEGNGVAPVNDEIASPGKPKITDIWVEWEDSSQTISDLSWDESITGRVHVAWEDNELGGGIDYWNIYTSGTHNKQTDEYHDTVYYSEVINDPSVKKGNERLNYADVTPSFETDGDYGRTVTMKVGAVNGMGESMSDEASLIVNSLPRFRAFPENGGAKLEWTDLFNDSKTAVTGWKIYRKSEYGAWEVIKTFDADEISYASGSDENSVKNYMYRDSALKNGYEYSYKVAAVCADGIDRPSVIRTVTPSFTSATEKCGTPLNLKATVADCEVLLTWDAPASGGAPETYYIEYLYRSDDNGTEKQEWVSEGSVSALSHSYVSRQYEPGIKTFRIYASNHVNGVDLRGDYSNEVSVEITQSQFDNLEESKPAKSIVTATTGDGCVILNWTYDKETGTKPSYYYIFREDISGNSSGDPIIITGEGETFTYTDDTVEAGVRYCYEVQSRNLYSGTSGNYIYITAPGESKDQLAANSVRSLINALPDPSDVTTEDADRINEAVKRYDSLTASQKALLSSDEKDKLNRCADRLEYLTLYGKYSDEIAPIQGSIDALPEAADVTLDNEAEIQSVRKAYDALTTAEAKKAVDISKLIAAEDKIRELKYSIAIHGSVSFSGKWIIGEEERPTITAYMYGEELASDNYKVGFVKTGSTVVQSSVFSSGYYRVVIMGVSPYYGRVISDELLMVYDVADILDNAKFSGSGEFAYTGKVIVPTFKVSVNGKWLEKNTDYVFEAYYRKNSDGTLSGIEASDIIEKGNYCIDIKPVDGGFYTGSCRYEFAIVDAPVDDPTAPGNITDPTNPSGQTGTNPSGQTGTNPSGQTGTGAGTGGQDTTLLGEDGTAVGKGASAEAAEKAITTSTSDEGPSGTKYGNLQFKSTKQTKNSVKCTWKKVSGAKKYIVYGNICGKKNKPVKIASTTGASITVSKINGKKLKKGTYYKFILAAVDKDNRIVSTSKTIYAATSGGKYCNYKSVSTKAKNNKVTIKAKKTFKLGAKMTKTSKKLKVKKCRGIAYESSNTAVATVSGKGVIKGVKKGTCYVYVYTQNGVSKKIKVVVK